MGCPPNFLNEVLSKQPRLCVYTVRGCCLTLGEMNNCDVDHVAQKPKIFTNTYARKSLHTSDLEPTAQHTENISFGQAFITNLFHIPVGREWYCYRSLNLLLCAKISVQGWGGSSEVEFLPSMLQALGSNPRTPPHTRARLQSILKKSETKLQHSALFSFTDWCFNLLDQWEVPIANDMQTLKVGSHLGLEVPGSHRK